MGKIALASAKVGDVVDEGTGKPTPRGLVHAFATLQDITLGEVHPIDPWWIVQCKAGMEFHVRQPLRREGFEAWHPTYTVFKPVPQRRLPSKTRHKRRWEVQQSMRPRWPGYVLVRRLFGSYPISRMYEIDGCGGLCVLIDYDGYPKPAIMPDYHVELARVAEAAGTYDQYTTVTEHMLLTGVIKDDPRYKRQHDTQGKVLGSLDESVGQSLFIDAGDRVIKVISCRADEDVVGVPR